MKTPLQFHWSPRAGDLLRDLPVDGLFHRRTVGSALQRVTCHYWYHTEDAQAIRQILDHRELPEYVRDLEVLPPYRPE